MCGRRTPVVLFAGRPATKKSGIGSVKYLDIEMSLRMNTQKRSDVVPTLDEP